MNESNDYGRCPNCGSFEPPERTTIDGVTTLECTNCGYEAELPPAGSRERIGDQ